MSSVLICVLSVTLTFPKFLIFVAITSIIFYFLQTVSRLVNRQLKIAESLTKSPMYGHLSSTTHGLETIHAFKKMADYTIRFVSERMLFIEYEQPLRTFYFLRSFLRSWYTHAHTYTHTRTRTRTHTHTHTFKSAANEICQIKVDCKQYNVIGCSSTC